MDFRVETVAPCRKKIAVAIPPDRIREEYDKKYDEINANFTIPGFRPGHAPRKLLERRFSTRLADEVKDDLIKAALEKLVDDEKVEPLAAPEIDLSDKELELENAFEFEFELVTKPEFETPTYEGLELKVPALPVDDEEIDAAVDQLRRRDAKLESAGDAAVADGDVLIVDWQLRDGDSVEARDENAYYPFGRGVLAGFVAEDLDEQLRGAKPGKQTTSKVQVAADDPREELRGRELELGVTLKEIKRYVLPEIDDDFLQKHDYDDVDELREEMSKGILRAKRRGRDRDSEDQLVEQLLDGIEISLPEEFVERELEGWAARKRIQLQMEKIEEEEISKQIDGARADTKAAIEHDMRRFFLLDRISDKEDVEATEAEMAQAIEEIAMAYGHPVEQVAASFRDGNRLAELRTEIRHRKARQIIRQKAKLTEEEAPAKPKAAKKKKKAAKKKAAASAKKASKKKAAKKKS